MEKINSPYGNLFKMQRSFTLLELIVVIIIVGILAALGFIQYTRVIEKSRGAEARTVCGHIRTVAAGYWLEKGLAGFGNTEAGIGPASDQIPGPTPADCRSTHYFFYQVFTTPPDQLQVIAVRCNNGQGKNPQGPAGLTYQLNLSVNFNTGFFEWVSNYGY